MFVILLSVWMILNNSLSPEIWISGVIISLILTWIFCANCQVFRDVRLTPKALLYTILYVFVFLYELIKSNLDVARRVVSPALPINPGIVRVETSLKSEMARLILANSITLTPGTLSLDIKDNVLYIHFVDIPEANAEQHARSVIEKFEKYLEVIYG